MSTTRAARTPYAELIAELETGAMPAAPSEEIARVAGLYVRISESRDGSTLGVERQEDDGRALGQSKGWRIGRLYVDNDVSASTGKPRPQYQQMLADLRDGLINAVIVWDLDRLCRRPVELEEFMELADRHGVALASVGGEVDLATPQGRMVARIKGAVARHESDQLARRVARKHRELAEQGKFHGGRRAYGYEKTGMRIVPAEAEVIRTLAARVLAGDSLERITRDLNADATPTVSGRPWSPHTVRDMLSGPRIAGLRSYQGRIIGEAAWPAILDRETWEAVRTRLLDPARRPPGQTNTRRHLLSGLARCSKCDAGLKKFMASSPKAGYACRNPECRKVRISAAHLERYVTKAVFAYLQREDVGPPAEDAPEDPELADLDRQILLLGDKKREVATRFATDPSFDADQLADITRALNEQLDKLNTQRDARTAARMHTDVMAGIDPERLPDLWDSGELSLSRKRSIIGMATDGVIIIDPAYSKGRGFEPRRVRVPAWEREGARRA